MPGTVKTFTGNTSPIVADQGDGAHVNAVVPLDKDGNPAAGPTAVFNSGTREHNTAGITRQAVGAASARVALPTLGASREVYVMASTRCFFLTGSSTVTAAAGNSHPLAQDERFYFRVPAGHTHIAFIQDTAAGNITICAVV